VPYHGGIEITPPLTIYQNGCALSLSPSFREGFGVGTIVGDKVLWFGSITGLQPAKFPSNAVITLNVDSTEGAIHPTLTRIDWTWTYTLAGSIAGVPGMCSTSATFLWSR
jgi:hypothetical protein